MSTVRNAAIVIACMLSGPRSPTPSWPRRRTAWPATSIDQKVIGPAYKDVAAKYAGQADAVPKLTQKVLKGGSGVWGAVPMPANPQVNEAEAKQLVEWILTLKK